MLVAPAVVLLAATATSYYAESRAAQTSRAVENSYEVKLKVASLQGDLTSAESALRGWVLTGREDFVVSFTTSADKVPADVTELASSVQDDPELREDVIRLRTLVTDRMTLFAQLKALGPISGGGSEATRVDRMRAGQ